MLLQYNCAVLVSTCVDIMTTFRSSGRWWPSSVGPSETLCVLEASDLTLATCCPGCSPGRHSPQPPRWYPSSGWWASGGCTASPTYLTPLSSWGANNDSWVYLQSGIVMMILVRVKMCLGKKCQASDNGLILVWFIFCPLGVTNA